MRAAIYCRVSTEDQEREGTSLQTQLEACLAYSQHKGYQIARRFSETYSGLAGGGRPGRSRGPGGAATRSAHRYHANPHHLSTPLIPLKPLTYKGLLQSV